MITDIARLTTQEINRLDAEGNVKEIERIVDSAEEKGPFLYGLRILSRRGFTQEKLDKKVTEYNARANPNYRVEAYYLESPDGGLTYRMLKPNTIL